jgi:hypothetical protein
MAKRKRETTPDIVERRIKEGRGTGRGANYKPWILVPDVPSPGLANRVKGVPATISCCWITALRPLTVDESRDLLAWNRIFALTDDVSRRD